MEVELHRHKHRSFILDLPAQLCIFKTLPASVLKNTYIVMCPSDTVIQCRCRDVQRNFNLVGKSGTGLFHLTKTIPSIFRIRRAGL